MSNNESNIMHMRNYRLRIYTAPSAFSLI